MSELNEDINGIRALCLVTLTLLIDAGVLTGQQVADRIQLFLDGMPPDRKAGKEGKLLYETLKKVIAANSLRPNLSVIQSDQE